MRIRYTAGHSSIAAVLAGDTAVPPDEAALIGVFAAQLAAVATRWAVAAVTAVSSGGTTGKSERAAIARLIAGCGKSRNYKAKTKNGSRKDFREHGFLQ